MKRKFKGNQLSDIGNRQSAVIMSDSYSSLSAN